MVPLKTAKVYMKKGEVVMDAKKLQNYDTNTSCVQVLVVTTILQP